MARRICVLIAIGMCWSQPTPVQAQLTYEEYQQFTKLIAQSDDKEAFEKRLKLIETAIEREAQRKVLGGGSYEVTLKQARIPADVGVPFLIKRLEQPSEYMRRASARMLAAYGAEAKAAVPNVLTLLKSKDAKAMRYELTLVLARIDPTNADSAAFLIERLGATEMETFADKATLQALAILASAVPKSDVPKIAKLLQHRSADVGAAAFEAIGKILAHERPTFDQLKQMQSIEWRESEDQGYAAISAIAEGGVKHEFAVPLLLGVLASNPPAYLEYTTLDALAKLRTGQPKAVAAAMERLPAKDFQVRNKARMAIFSFDLKAPESVRVLAAGLRDKDLGVRQEVASALRMADVNSRMSPPSHAEMLDPLLDALAEAEEKIAPHYLEQFLHLLRRFGARAAPAADPLFKLYQSEAYFKPLGPSAYLVRGKLLATFANIGVPASAREHLVHTLQVGPDGPDAGYAYAAAARAAGNFFPHRDLVPLLIPGLLNTEPERFHPFIDWSGEGFGRATTVRIEAARALAKIGPDAADALPILKSIAYANFRIAPTMPISVSDEARRAYAAIGVGSAPPLTGIFADGNMEALHLDERLQVKMVLKLRYPRPKDVLNRLEQATKLKFTMDDAIDPDFPVWASTFSSGMPAYAAMRNMAAAPTVQGAWEDTGDGYRLVAKNKVTVKKPDMPPPPFHDDSFDPLPEDPRLKKILTIHASTETALDVLKRLQDETGVTLALEKIDTESGVSHSWQKLQAWQIMRSLAESPRVNGTWVKVGDGYILRGSFTPRSAAARPVAPQKAIGQVGLPQAPDTGTSAGKTPTSLFIVVGISFVILLGAAMVLMVRVLRQPS